MGIARRMRDALPLCRGRRPRRSLLLTGPAPSVGGLSGAGADGVEAREGLNIQGRAEETIAVRGI